MHAKDVEKAVFPSAPINRLLSVRPPKAVEINSDTICRFHTAAYGLTDAARKWCNRKYHGLDLKRSEIQIDIRKAARIL